MDNNKRYHCVDIADDPFLRRLAAILILLLAVAGQLDGQETHYGPGYSTILVLNPAFSGAEGSGKLRLSYLNFFPGNHFNLHSFHASYDSYFPALHGGAGLWFSNDYLGGIVNDLRGGLSYAYFLQAGEEVFINAGLAAGMFRRGFSFGNAVLPGMIDPSGVITAPSETLTAENRMVFDVNAGFLLSYRNFNAGIALNHLSRPDISEGEDHSFLERKLNITASADFPSGDNRKISFKPSFFLGIQPGSYLAGLGTSVETESISFNTLAFVNNPGAAGVQAGFSVRSGIIEVYYNYRFNISSHRGVLPFSLLHQTGLSITVNKPDKRSVLSTISIPDL